MRRRRRKSVEAEPKVADQNVGWATLAVGLAVTTFLFWKNQQGMPFDEYYLLNTALLLWVPLIVVLVFLRREASDFAMTSGNLRSGLLTALVLFVFFVPVILIFSPSKAFQDYYVRSLADSQAISSVRGYALPGLAGGKPDYGRLLYHEVVIGFYMFGWEWFFRGFLLFGLKRLMPVTAAAFLQAAAFTLLHYGKPWPELASSFFGALILAVVALRSGSFLPCFVLHWAIHAAFEFAVLYHHFR